MSDPNTDKPDELAGTEQPFVQHLVELRDRMIKAVIAIGIAAAVLAVYPGASALYDLMAAPLVATLPKGSTLIAISVITPFVVPIKILFMAAFMIALPVVLYQVWAFVAPACIRTRKNWSCRW
jgi:sec-independent protein translocase protein TatC